MKNFVKQLNDKLQENNRKIWGNHVQITRNKSFKKKKNSLKSAPHYLKACLQHILILKH